MSRGRYLLVFALTLWLAGLFSVATGNGPLAAVCLLGLTVFVVAHVLMRAFAEDQSAPKPRDSEITVIHVDPPSVDDMPKAFPASPEALAWSHKQANPWRRQCRRS